MKRWQSKKGDTDVTGISTGSSYHLRDGKQRHGIIKTQKLEAGALWRRQLDLSGRGSAGTIARGPWQDPLSRFKTPKRGRQLTVLWPLSGKTTLALQVWKRCELEPAPPGINCHCWAEIHGCAITIRDRKQTERSRSLFPTLRSSLSCAHSQQDLTEAGRPRRVVASSLIAKQSEEARGELRHQLRSQRLLTSSLALPLWVVANQLTCGPQVPSKRMNETNLKSNRPLKSAII